MTVRFQPRRRRPLPVLLSFLSPASSPALSTYLSTCSSPAFHLLSLSAQGQHSLPNCLRISNVICGAHNPLFVVRGKQQQQPKKICSISPCSPFSLFLHPSFDTLYSSLTFTITANPHTRHIKHDPDYAFALFVLLLAQPGNLKTLLQRTAGSASPRTKQG
jgi:hypothetical protein